MANPNLNAVTYVYCANTQVSLVTTTETQVISNAAGSNKVLLVDSILVSNVDGANAADITVTRYTAATNVGTPFRIARTITVPANASIIVVGSENKLNITEAESIYVSASAANRLHVDANWKELS